MTKLFSLFAIFLCSLYANAQEPMNPEGSYSQIFLSVRIVDPEGPMVSKPRGPIQPPTVYLSDHTLYIYGDGRDFDLQVVTYDETVVYSTYVSSSTSEVQLPTTLSGDYLLQLFNGDFVFIGEINL